MKDHMEKYNATTLFQKAIRKARMVSILSSGFGGKSYKIPNLERLTKVVSSTSESYLGTKNIKVSLIIGTENRSSDFTIDFLPKKYWMENRWTTVMVKFLNDEITEPIKVIEYGGAYFVRDGNHRVSVSKSNKIEYITAEIIRYDLPFNLPSSFDMSKIDNFKAKAQFHQRTKIFDHIDENIFTVNRAETWKALEREIFIDNRAWFIRRNEREPADTLELLQSWNKNIYGNTIEYLKTNSLLYLFHGLEVTDVFILFVNFWNSLEKPDNFWLEEVYTLFSKKVRRRKFYLALLQIWLKMLRSLMESTDSAKTRFYKSTQIEELRPDFTIPIENKRILVFLYQQVFMDHALFLKTKLKRAPFIQEITADWFDHYYQPLKEHYASRKCILRFDKFYRKFSKRYFRQFISESSELGIYINDFCGQCPND